MAHPPAPLPRLPPSVARLRRFEGGRRLGPAKPDPRRLWWALLRALQVLLLLVVGAASASAADLEAGKARAATACAVCHGPTGLSMQPNVPHLAGQPLFYLTEQLRNYRSGKRTNEVMAVIAKPLTDAEIDNLALWYSSLQVRVEAP
jgi:cytochrome c553